MKQGIMQIEKFQRRFTKKLHNLQNVENFDRLNRLGLPTLELWRLQLDLIDSDYVRRLCLV